MGLLPSLIPLKYLQYRTNSIDVPFRFLHSWEHFSLFQYRTSHRMGLGQYWMSPRVCTFVPGKQVLEMSGTEVASAHATPWTGEENPTACPVLA